MKKKIEITDVLACEMLEALTCTYISFDNSVFQDENDEPNISDEGLKASSEWAANTFNEIIKTLCKKFGVDSSEVNVVLTGKLDSEYAKMLWGEKEG